MHSSSDSSQAATGPFLRVAFVLVLSVAALAGVLVSDGSHIGLVVLGLALVAGPVAVVAEERRRGATA